MTHGVDPGTKTRHDPVDRRLAAQADAEAVTVYRRQLRLADDEQLEYLLANERRRIDLVVAEAGAYSHETSLNSLVDALSALAAVEEERRFRQRHGLRWAPTHFGYRDAVIADLKARVRLEDLIGETLPLTRRGSRLLVSRCPFHQERTPSFTVYPETQSYYCYGCLSHGDAITWVRWARGCDFRQAVAYLAERAGVPLPAMGIDPGRQPATRLAAPKGVRRAR